MNCIVSNVVTPRVNFRANTLDNEKNVAFKENSMVVTKQADNGAKILLGLSALATTAVAAVALVKNKKITGEVKNLTEKLRKTEAVNTELAEKVKNLEDEAQKVAKKAEEKAKKSRPVRNYYSYDTNYYTKPEKENVFTLIKDWFSDNVFIRKTSNKSRKVHKNRKPNIFTKIKNKFSSNTRRTQRGQGTQRTQKANIFDKVNNWFVEQKNAFSTKKLERSEKRAARKAEKARQNVEGSNSEQKPNVFTRAKD